MRSLEEIQERWRATQAQSSSLDELRRAVRYNGPTSPCVAGLRSVCWKTFLLSKEGTSDWTQILMVGREDYARRRENLLKYVKHPEALAELTVDPLADDPNSPWDTVRQDEIIRTEIQQDVQRLPDEANYHDERIQTMILDILFVYCKTYPDRGGYRQGMHELLAPIVHVLGADAINRITFADAVTLDETLLDLVDSRYIEHDAYLLFTRLMDSAQSFYAVNDASGRPSYGSMVTSNRGQSSSIVERSKFIHEVCLQKIDPDLASHLISIEILPQIFLIRWVRLLYSREFPFDQFLVLWDTIFAVDPSLELIDLICVSMLIRIRWQLLEADYSVCLQLLLKYPAPDEPHGPHTFVDDAVYLQGHMHAQGGATLIMKYTGRMPTVAKSPETSRPSTPSFRNFSSLRPRGLGVRSPSSFINQQNGVEALFQGAAKGARGVFERGEKLGINQAVRDAMGEIRKNVQGFNESKPVTSVPREVLSEGDAATALATMERRNQQLACMLGDTVSSLKAVSAANLDDSAEARTKNLELIEVAAAKIQFVKIYLEDSSMEVPDVEVPVDDADRMDTDEKLPPAQKDVEADDVDVSQLSLDAKPGTAKEQPSSSKSPEPTPISTPSDPLSTAAPVADRPTAVPTRSTLAQSSFSWMLEPDESSSSPKRDARMASKSPPVAAHKKRPSNSASRDRNAFLFGEVTNDTEGRDPLKDDIFGLETLRKSK